MTKWEYCRVGWMMRRVDAEQRRQLEAEGRNIRFVEAGDQTLAQSGTLTYFGSSDEGETFSVLNDAIAQLGREGWELVSHSQITTPVAVEVLFFKRQIVE